MSRGPPILLTGEDLAHCLPMSAAIGAVEEALAERAAGSSATPPRTTWELPPSAMTITPGGFQGLGVHGLRVYVRGGPEDQLTAVWELRTGQLLGILLGPELGALRTGAIGGVAVDRMAGPSAARVGVVGGGRQARAQLEAIRAVRPGVREVRIFRRDPARRSETASRWARETGLDVRAAGSASEAVADASIVVLATDSDRPVLDADALPAGAHVNTLGPKYRGRSEIGLDLLRGADWIVSDFPEQYRSDPEFIAQGTPELDRMQDLARFKARERPAGIRSVFLSHGLAGTEVAVAYRALERAGRLGIGQLLGR